MLGVSWALGGLASLLAILVAVFLLEIIAGILPPRRVTTTVAPGDRKLRPRVAVLIPAHNESAGIRATLDDIRCGCSSSFQRVDLGDCRIVVLPTERLVAGSSEWMTSAGMRALLQAIRRDFQSWT